MSPKLTYVSLFSSAGLGCYGLKLAGFECLATAELLERRIAIQRANKVGDIDDVYYSGDLTDEIFFSNLLSEVSSRLNSKKKLDLLVATPPCQGMSVANHKKKDELPRNSLVVKSIEAVLELRPRVFVFENVRAFLTSICLDLDGTHKSIKNAILDNLAGQYVIDFKTVNFKDFGSQSSRTRTLVIGTTVKEPRLSPSQLFPSRQTPMTLRQLIGSLPSLKKMGEIDADDIYHSFRKYDERMLPWIKATRTGKSAFDNESESARPHQVKDGHAVENLNKNGDKYKRQLWDQIGPCVHTRNDILASQNTVHPKDNRVFSIRELMLMMGVPETFKWSQEEVVSELNSLRLEAKLNYLKKHELTIRQCLGEGVPTPIFQQIGEKLKNYDKGVLPRARREIYGFEESNPRKAELAAFYTQPAAAAAVVRGLSSFFRGKEITILEPSAGAGAFMPELIHEFQLAAKVSIDLVEIDPKAASKLEIVLAKLDLPPHFSVRVICADFLSMEISKKYDLVVGNPPFGKPDGQKQLNLFVQFVDKCLDISSHVAFVLPKSLVGASEHSSLRQRFQGKSVSRIIDFGQAAFDQIRIETMGIVASTKSENAGLTRVDSWIQAESGESLQNYLMDEKFPSWLLYRNDFFDSCVKHMKLGQFESMRDRQIKVSMRGTKGSIRLIRGRDIRQGQLDTEDSGLRIAAPEIPKSALAQVGKQNAIIVPNLTYYTRAARFPDNAVADGSCALLYLKSGGVISDQNCLFFSSDIFFYFYRIAMNFSVRSLNVDKASRYFWGVPDNSLIKQMNLDFKPTVKNLFQSPSAIPN
jgi:DNA (cytosine-5)-methyltransferase 1